MLAGSHPEVEPNLRLDRFPLRRSHNHLTQLSRASLPAWCALLNARLMRPRGARNYAAISRGLSAARQPTAQGMADAGFAGELEIW
jgi:hypothetical protein